MKRHFVLSFVLVLVIMILSVLPGAAETYKSSEMSVTVPSGYICTVAGTVAEIEGDANNNEGVWMRIEIHAMGSGESLESIARRLAGTYNGDVVKDLEDEDNGETYYLISENYTYRGAPAEVYVDGKATIRGLGSGKYAITIIGLEIDDTVIDEIKDSVKSISASGGGNRNNGGNDDDEEDDDNDEEDDDDSSGCNAGISAFAVLGAFLAFRKKNG